MTKCCLFYLLFIVTYFIRRPVLFFNWVFKKGFLSRAVKALLIFIIYMAKI